MKYSALPIAIMLATTNAYGLDGKIVNRDGEPIAVLSGGALRNQQASTLGDSLERQPGVDISFHGNVASTPVIRGLSGPRVLITQNGLDVGDQSRIGPDHAVGSEVSTAQQVEILRGPATLFYSTTRLTSSRVGPLSQTFIGHIMRIKIRLLHLKLLQMVTIC